MMENSTGDQEQGHRCHFPNEILLHIIKLVTQCLGELSILDWMEPSGPPINPLETGRLPFDQICNKWKGKQIRGLVDPQYRLNLALVSRTLYSMMLPILYHTVVLTKQSQLESFVEFVHQRRDLTHLVKILSVDIEWDYALALGRKFDAILRDVYFRCPNLIAFDYDLHFGVDFPFEMKSSEIERYSPRLQYLNAAELLVNYKYRRESVFPHLINPYLSLYSQVRYLSLAFQNTTPHHYTPTLSLPNLELLSITVLQGYREEVDEYIAQAKLPKLHALHITFDRNILNYRLINPLEVVRELLKTHGSKLVTLKIIDDQYRYADYQEQVPSLQLQGYLSNLQQLIVNENCRVSILHEMGHCPSLRNLEFTDIQPGKWRSGRRLYHLLIGNPLRRFGFESIRTIRFSAVPTLSGHEYVSNSVVETWIPGATFMEQLDAFIKEHRKLFEYEGIELVSKIEVQPQEG